MTVTERKHAYPCATLAETTQSLADLMRRYDHGLVRGDEYHPIRRRLVRAAIEQREKRNSELLAQVRAVDWDGSWRAVLAPLRMADLLGLK